MSGGAWLSTLRVRTLPAAASPVLVGCALAYAGDGLSAGPALAALAGALLLQIGTNLANDYYDHKKGADTPERAGPQRASASGLLPPESIRNAAYGVFAAALVIGGYLVAIGGWPIVIIGLAGILAGVFYTAGPKPLAYVGLGDLFAFVFFGPVAVAGTVYVQTGDWSGAADAWGVAIGALVTAILVVNNLRDRPTDERAGKRTLAVRFGDTFARLEYTLLLWLAYAIVLGVAAATANPWILLPMASLPLAVKEARNVWQDHDDRSALNSSLGGTGRVLSLYAVLLSVGLLL